MKKNDSEAEKADRSKTVERTRTKVPAPTREELLAQQMRENLRKRKDQSRARAERDS